MSIEDLIKKAVAEALEEFHGKSTKAPSKPTEVDSDEEEEEEEEEEEPQPRRRKKKKKTSKKKAAKKKAAKKKADDDEDGEEEGPATYEEFMATLKSHLAEMSSEDRKQAQITAKKYLKKTHSYDAFKDVPEEELANVLTGVLHAIDAL